MFYDQAKVKILNPAYLNSANELRVEFEKNALVQVQPRRAGGRRASTTSLNQDVNLGGTALHLLENQAPGHQPREHRRRAGQQHHLRARRAACARTAGC
ncbi:MAG: hypothetical protein WKG07_15020 [Hymenobacter sp.]